MLGLPLSPTRLFQQLFLCQGYCAAVFTGNPSLSGSAHSSNETGLAYTADTIDLDPLLPAGMDFRGPQDSDSHSEAETLQYILSDNEDSVGDDDAMPAGAGQGRRCRDTPELLREAALRSDVLQPLQRQPGVETLQRNALGNTNSAGDDVDIPAFTGHGQSSRETPALLWGVALQSDVLQPLQRQPSLALDDGQLAVYLQYRGVGPVEVIARGVYFYFVQHEYECETQRSEVTQQLHETLADEDTFGALVFFRFMLEGDCRESFYSEIYRLVLDRIRGADRVTFFADVMRTYPGGDADEDACTLTELDTDDSAARDSDYDSATDHEGEQRRKQQCSSSSDSCHDMS